MSRFWLENRRLGMALRPALGKLPRIRRHRIGLVARRAPFQAQPLLPALVGLLAEMEALRCPVESHRNAPEEKMDHVQIAPAVVLELMIFHLIHVNINRYR
mmetsp:Transcript_21197/g.54044  ORF Transcript_21197/g.54044 Transcript_21197/m.54044 type:complete len:101 (-) Transcript_21197:146-448(-)